MKDLSAPRRFGYWRAGGRLRRFVVGAGAFVVAAEIAYLSAANALLAWDGSRRLFGHRPEKALVEWDRAWTWAPGIIHLTGIRVRVQSRNVQWLATLDRARVSFRLFPLALRHFSARSVRGSGLVFLLRKRLDSPHGADRNIDDWPAIPGLANPPDAVSDGGGGPPKHDPWRITIDQSRLDDVRHVWIGPQRMEGDGWAEGRLYAEVGRSVTIERAGLHMRSCGITQGKDTVARELSLDAVLSIDPFTIKGASWPRVWPLLSGELRCAGPLVSLEFLNRYLDRAPWLRLGGSGALRADLVVVHGSFQPGSVVEAEAKDISLGILQHELRGSGKVHGSVQPGLKPEGHLELELTEFEVRRGAMDAPYVRGSGFRFVAISDGTDFGPRLPDLTVTLDLPESQVARFEVYGAYLPEGAGLRIASGSGKIRGRVEVSTASMTGAGDLVLVGDEIHGRYEDLPLAGDLKLEMHLAPTREPDGSRAAPAFSVPRVQFDLTHVVAGAPQRGDLGWWGKFELTDGAVALKPWELSGSFSAKLKDTRPLVAVFAEKNLLVALFDGLLAVDDVNATGRIELDERMASIQGLTLKGRNMEVLADLKLSKDRKEGLLFAERGKLHFAVELGADGREWKLANARRWFEAKRRARAP